MGQITLVCPSFRLSAGYSCLNRLGLLAALGPLQHCSGGWFVCWQWRHGAYDLDVEGFIFWLEGSFLSSCSFLMLLRQSCVQNLSILDPKNGEDHVFNEKFSIRTKPVFLRVMFSNDEKKHYLKFLIWWPVKVLIPEAKPNIWFLKSSPELKSWFYLNGWTKSWSVLRKDCSLKIEKFHNLSPFLAKSHSWFSNIFELSF